MIRTDSLEVTYPGSARALKPCSVAFERGAVTVLLGSSGAGKSTLLRAMNGLVTPTGGRVAVEGIGDLSRRRNLQAHRRKTGMVFQQHQLIGRASVLTNVLMGRLGYHSGLRTLLPPARSEKSMALDAIERVGLIDHALRRADQLSGGQQQRVGIARAMVQQPTLILADEPVASLDPATAEHVLSLLHGICKSDGITAIISLHQLEFARRYSDRIVALAQGTVVFDGPASRLGKTEVAKIYGKAPVEAEELSDDVLPLKTGTYS